MYKHVHGLLLLTLLQLSPTSLTQSVMHSTRFIGYTELHTYNQKRPRVPRSTDSLQASSNDSWRSSELARVGM